MLHMLLSCLIGHYIVQIIRLYNPDIISQDDETKFISQWILCDLCQWCNHTRTLQKNQLHKSSQPVASLLDTEAVADSLLIN